MSFEPLRIVAMAVAAAMVYGVLHDQVTARICVEYFTIGHAPIFGTESPTLLGLGWGVLATWWVGVLMGIPLAFAARLGQRPKLATDQLATPLCVLMLVTAAGAVLAGLMGFLAARNGWVILLPPLAERVPADRHVAFLTDLWAHGASYAGGFVGGMVLIGWVWWKRIQLAQCEPNEN